MGRFSFIFGLIGSTLHKQTNPACQAGVFFLASNATNLSRVRRGVLALWAIEIGMWRFQAGLGSILPLTIMHLASPTRSHTDNDTHPVCQAGVFIRANERNSNPIRLGVSAQGAIEIDKFSGLIKTTERPFIHGRSRVTHQSLRQIGGWFHQRKSRSKQRYHFDYLAQP